MEESIEESLDADNTDFGLIDNTSNDNIEKENDFTEDYIIKNQSIEKPSNQIENNSEDLNDSMQPENGKSFKCKRCDKTFTADRNLKRHIYTVHEGHKDFQCEQCHQFYSSKQVLERHMKTKNCIRNNTNIQIENDSEDLDAENIDYDLVDNSNEIENEDDFTKKAIKNEAMDITVRVKISKKNAFLRDFFTVN